MRLSGDESARSSGCGPAKTGVSSVVLAAAAGREVRIHAAEIEEQSVSRLSPMPSNMADQIGERNLPDLLAYLMQAR